jgi:hypothetical protein
MKPSISGFQLDRKKCYSGCLPLFGVLADQFIDKAIEFTASNVHFRCSQREQSLFDFAQLAIGRHHSDQIRKHFELLLSIGGEFERSVFTEGELDGTTEVGFFEPQVRASIDKQRDFALRE